MVYAPNPTVGLVVSGNIEFLSTNGGLQFLGQFRFPSSQKFFLRDLSSNITLSAELNSSDTIQQYGNGLVLDNVVPVYVLNFPYQYNVDNDDLNITGRSSVEAILTLDTSTVWASGIKIYNVTEYITAAPIYDAGAFKLTFTLGAAGFIQVYTASESKPIRVIMDTVEYMEDNGWTWNATSNIVTTTFSGIGFEVTWSGGGAPGGGGAPSGGAPQVLEVEDVVGAVEDVVTPRMDNRLVTGGVVAIVFLVGFAYANQEWKKRDKPSSIWEAKTVKNAKKKIPWKDKELKY